MRELIVGAISTLCAAVIVIGRWRADRETPEERRLRGLEPMGDGWGRHSPIKRR